ncbi:hypothetical protein [Georgenia sp.]
MTLDVEAFLAEQGEGVRWIQVLLTRTAERPQRRYPPSMTASPGPTGLAVVTDSRPNQDRRHRVAGVRSSHGERAHTRHRRPGRHAPARTTRRGVR